MADVLDDFQLVSEEDKDFLIEVLEHATTDEIDQLLQPPLDAPTDGADARKQPERHDLATAETGFERTKLEHFTSVLRAMMKELTDSAQYPKISAKVRLFVATHPFMIQRARDGRPTVARRRQFTRDIYDYARALGMNQQRANLEIKLAREAYRQQCGLVNLIDDDASSFGDEREGHEGSGRKKKRKRRADSRPSTQLGADCATDLKIVPGQRIDRVWRFPSVNLWKFLFQHLITNPNGQYSKIYTFDHPRWSAGKSPPLVRHQVLASGDCHLETSDTEVEDPTDSEHELSSFFVCGIDNTESTQPGRRASVSPRKSPYFASTPQETATTGVSCIPFARLDADSFGLLQEKHAHEPLKLLIGVTFLNRTHGKHAIPVFYELLDKYQTAEDLAAASKEDIVHITRHLGLQSVRADKYIRFAKTWLEHPPSAMRRYRVPHYPDRGSGLDVRRTEVLNEADPRVGWEIGHVTQGRYALDSWRIFCRDVLRGVATGWNGEGSCPGFQPEWMRVVPDDKELRAFLRWMWLREGFDWNPRTGDKTVASAELLQAAMDGRITSNEAGDIRVVQR